MERQFLPAENVQAGSVPGGTQVGPGAPPSEGDEVRNLGSPRRLVFPGKSGREEKVAHS